MTKKRKNIADTHHTEGFLLVEPKLAKHLITLLHNKGSFVSVRRNIRIHLKPNKSNIIKSMWNTAVGIKNCKQLLSLRLAFTAKKKSTHTAEMMSVPCVAIFWAVNASSDEKSGLQFSILTESGAGGEGGVLHALKMSFHREGGGGSLKM